MNRMRTGVEMNVVVGPEAEGARRATGALGPTLPSRAIDPDPEVSATAQRRRCPAEYRLRILKEADGCTKPGEVGALLRREGLYSSLLTNWRRQREAGALREMPGRRRGPTPRPVDPRVKQLGSPWSTVWGSRAGTCHPRNRSVRPRHITNVAPQA